MYLLQFRGADSFDIFEYTGSDIPRYAILSHTWGSDKEEVTFRDITNGLGKEKAGYRKIRFCANQAAKDDIHHFWVDTCCIDKSSSAELQEAINSMFRWYHNAAKCYVYLSDVSIINSKGQILRQEVWKPTFQKSRWFTRGWTLQELLAPTVVEFFSKEGELLGDKDMMVEELAEITRISVDALKGAPLSNFTVEERMSWSEKRNTKREEDKAYCLLGIFDVHIPLIYGEGHTKAWRRLKDSIQVPSSSAVVPKTLLHARLSRPSTIDPGFLYNAARWGNTKIVEHLLAAGADVNATLTDGDTALFAAVQNNHFDTTKFLLQRGAKPSIGKDPLFAASGPGANPGIMLLLLQAKADPKTPWVLHNAARWGITKAVEDLLAAGADVNWISEDGDTAIFAAAQHGQVETAKSLMQRGADPFLGKNALMAASGPGAHPDLMPILLQADVGRTIAR